MSVADARAVGDIDTRTGGRRRLDASRSLEAVDFPLDRGLNLPVKMTSHRLDDKVLYVVADKAMWLTTSLPGSELLERLRRGRTVRQARDETALRSGASTDEVERELCGLLRQIAIKNFYQDLVPEADTAEPDQLNLQIHLTQNCNLRCKHCYMDSGIRLGWELDLAEWQGVIDQFVELGGASVTYSGGEPLLYPEFFELAEYVKGKHLGTLLITNGTLIRNISKAQSLSRVVDKVRVSVDGGTPVGHELIRGRGTFAPTRRALVLLAQAGVPVEIAITLYPQNVDDVMDNLAGLLEGLSRLGVEAEKVGIARGMLEGRATDTLTALEFEEKFLEIKRQLHGPLWDLTRFKALKLTTCGYGESLTVSATGAVHPCGLFYRAGGNVRTTPLSRSFALFQAEKRASTVDRMQPCASCDLRHICGGGCRVISRKQTDQLCRAACSRRHRETYYRRLMIRDEVFFRISAIVDRQSRTCNSTSRERR